MKELNKAWLILIFAGILALLFSVGLRIYQSTTGQNDEFTQTVNEISGTTLFIEKVEEHLLEDPELQEN